MKTILLITSELPPQPGGIGNHAHQLAKYLCQYYHVQVLADLRSEQGDEEMRFDERQAFEVIRVKRFAFILWTYLKRILTGFQLSKKADLILVSGKFPLWVGGILSIMSSVPIVGIIHGTEVQLNNYFAKRLTSWSLTRFRHVIGVSKFTLKLVSHLKLKQSSVIPNGFDLSESLKLNTSMEKLSSSSSEKKSLELITVGNLTQRKGQHNVIKALPMLKENYPDVMYHCVGIPTDIEKLKAIAKSLQVEPHVQFHGRVSEDRKFKLLRQANIFMMLSEQTSTGDVEGFGIAILEANALNLPAIGSKGCGIEDAVQDYYSGVLVDPHKPTEIVNAIKEISKKQNLYAKQAKEWSTHFTWDKIGRAYDKVVKSCV